MTRTRAAVGTFQHRRKNSPDSHGSVHSSDSARQHACTAVGVPFAKPDLAMGVLGLGARRCKCDGDHIAIDGDTAAQRRRKLQRHFTAY